MKSLCRTVFDGNRLEIELLAAVVVAAAAAVDNALCMYMNALQA